VNRSSVDRRSCYFHDPHRSIIGRSTAQRIIRTVDLIHLGVNRLAQPATGSEVVIAFEVDADQVAILGVFYGGQDYETPFEEEKDEEG
jgi:hypothetical protein